MRAFVLFLACFVPAYIFPVDGEECIYDDSGECMEWCPPDTYSYSPSCEEEVMSQRTCRSPVARPEGIYCDYSRCDCEEPKVWDEDNKKCILIKDCPEISQNIYSNMIPVAE